MQHFLKTPPGAARAEILAPELLDKFLITVDKPRAAVGAFSDGKPLRRLLIGSKAVPILMMFFVVHGTPPVL
jgi:hypothetical protein